MRFNDIICAFFISSRRRHTRWNCDWSSDVCSSDLVLARAVAEGRSGPGPRAELPVRLLLRGSGHPTSREQARRALAGAEGFAEVVLDFSGVAAVGPAFADELARAIPAELPEVRILWRNASQAVAEALAARSPTRRA